MGYTEIYERVKKIKKGSKETVLKGSDFEIYIFRPQKKIKNHNINKNFQIFLKLSNGRVFKPNHLIVMIDLNLRIRDNVAQKKNLLKLFDNIFYKKDYSKDTKKIKTKSFKYFLYDIEIISTLYSLFLIEQEYNYPEKKSKYNPKTLFLHGWVRQFMCDGKEIDNLVMSVCKGYPPKTKYTSQDDLNHKKYNKNRDDLWYLD